MSIRIDAKAEVFLGLGNEIPVSEAIERKPYAEEKVIQCEREFARAAAETNRLRAVCDDDRDLGLFIANASSEATKALHDLQANTRPEFHALRADFAIDDHVERMGKLAARVRYLDSEYEFLVWVQMGSNQVLHCDSVVNLLSAEHALLGAKFQLSRITTIAALGPIMESEGHVGIMGAKSEALREATDAKYQQLLLARNDARDARLKYEQRLNVRVARGGIIASQQVSNSVPKY